MTAILIAVAIMFKCDKFHLDIRDQTLPLTLLL